MPKDKPTRVVEGGLLIGSGPIPPEILAALQGGGGNAIIEDDSVRFGEYFTIPHGMTYERAFEILERKQQEEDAVTEYKRQYLYRLNDGLFATSHVLKDLYGITLARGTMFSLPDLVDVEVAFEETVQVPGTEGVVQVPGMEGVELSLGAVRHPEHGRIFQIRGAGKRKYKDKVEALFNAIGEFLQTNSIYRGKAFAGSETPKFLDLSKFESDKVVFADDVRSQLDTALFGPLRYTEAMRRDGIPRKRSVLLHGPYGTGKTLTGQLTAKEAVAHGWTFIAVRPGQDNLDEIMKTARLYEPAVVFAEDVDIRADGSNTDSEAVSQLLDVFDGITAKGGEIIVVMTTNHIDRIHKGMLRPGRLDALVHIGALDRHGIEALIKTSVDAAKLDKDIDYKAVYKSMEGFFPAFAKEVVNRACGVALARVGGKSKYNLTTEDLCAAALSLRPQLEIMEAANEGANAPTLDTALRGIVQHAVDGTAVEDSGGDKVFELAVAPNGSGK